MRIITCSETNLICQERLETFEQSLAFDIFMQILVYW